MFRGIAAAGLMLVACSQPATPLPGEGEPLTPCDQVLEGCVARRLDNVVLRGGAKDGAFGPIDGLDATDVIGFDEALAAAGANDLRADDAETVQVVLGGADAEKLHWGTGGARLFYAVKWGGVEMPLSGPPGFEHPREFGTWTSVIDATTGRWIVGGS